MKFAFSSVWLGLIVLVGVLYFGVFAGFSALDIFFNEHAIILVFGGTLGITLITYPFSMLMEIYEFLLYGFLLKRSHNTSKIAFDLLSSIYRVQKGASLADLKGTHNFVKDAIRVMADGKYGVDDTVSVLESTKMAFSKKYTEHAKVMQNISKFPPALGLLGASTGMIQMMMNLGTGGAASIGASMAVALTATFWGIALANFVFLPLADYAFRLAEEDIFVRNVIIDAAVLVKEGASFEVLTEAVSNRLPIYERFKVLNDVKMFVKADKGKATSDNVVDLRSSGRFEKAG